MSDQTVARPGSRRPGRYNPDDPYLPADQRRRHAALTSAAGGIKVRAGRIPVETVLLVGACILFPLGLVFILLGWYGAAHTGRTYAQIDYLISGGLLGVGISVAGGFMYFGYWLSRQLGESRRQSNLTLQALRRLEDAIAGHSLSNGSVVWPAENGGASSAQGNISPTGAKAAKTRSIDDQADPTGEVPMPTLVATARGSLLHFPDCPVVANKPRLKEVPAGTEGYGYCTMCDTASTFTTSPGGSISGG